MSEHGQAAADTTTQPGKPGRLRSLDAFRGFDIAAMILVNMTWSRDANWIQLFHIGWNEGRQGATLTDLVFPWFLFIAGVAMPFSMTRGRGAALPAWRKIVSAFRRGLVIYTLGLVLDAASSGQFVFFKWNILQLIGAAYFVGVVLMLLPIWARAAVVGLVLGVKWFVLSVFRHPEHGESVWYFAVDGVEVANRYAKGAIPVNGEQHFKSIMLTWRDDLPFASSIDWGPFLNWATSIFNLLPATTVVVMGGFVGHALLRDSARRASTAVWMIGVGLGLWLLSWLWNLHHPWSKDFFTASYALLSVGTGTALLGVFYLLIDAEAWWRSPAWLEWTGERFVNFCRVMGVNAIAIYFANEFVFKAIMTKWRMPVLSSEQHVLGAYREVLAGWSAGLFGEGGVATVSMDFAFALTWLGVWWLFAWWLDRRRIYIKV